MKAIRNHRVLSSPLDELGDADLSCDVDFHPISAALMESYPKGKIGSTTFSNLFAVKIDNLQSQRDFLLSNCIRERAQYLANSNPDKHQEIRDAYSRLTNPQEMGKIYKVLTAHSPKA